MAGNKPTPQYEVQNNLQDRGLQVSRDNDSVQTITVGVKDIDEALFYYFNNILKPQVTQNGKTINVPLVYASPERWAAMQKDGYYRDKNGKMQAPLITFRRNNIERNRNLGNKLDGNNPQNFGILDQYTCTAEGNNPMCGDSLTVYVNVENNIISPPIDLTPALLDLHSRKTDLKLEVQIGSIVNSKIHNKN